MLDISNIPNSTNYTQTFYAISGSNAWQTWIKPRGAKIIQIFCLGGGGGGSQGGVNSSGLSPAYGGGGGGGSSITQGLFPAFLLPDTLYIQVGIGGFGGPPKTAIGNPPAGNAGNGGLSYVSVGPTSSIGALILASGTTAAAGATGLGGSGGTVFVNTAFSNLGFIKTTAGVDGADSSTTADAFSITALTSSMVMGGAAGGGRTNGALTGFNAGSVLSSSIFLTTTLPGGAGTSGSAGQNGRNGYGFFSPIFCGTGGSGGGGSLSGWKGGDGGNGFYGCGGGGGGGTQQPFVGTSPTGSGKGGNGGNGLVIITTIY